MLREAGHEVIDFGDRQPKLEDDYPDFVVPLARRVASLVWELVGTFLARDSAARSVIAAV